MINVLKEANQVRIKYYSNHLFCFSSDFNQNVLFSIEYLQVVNPKLFELSKSSSHGNSRSRYNNNNRGNTGANNFNRNNNNDRRTFGNNANANRPNNGYTNNSNDNGFKRDREPGREAVSRFSANESANRYPNHSSTNGSSRFSSIANSSSSNVNTASRYGTSTDTRYPSSNNTANAVRDSGSRFSATGASRFSNNDAYKSNDSYKAPSISEAFYSNSSSKFKANGYDNKPKAPTSNSANASMNYQQSYNGYGSEAIFSYPPPPIH